MTALERALLVWASRPDPVPADDIAAVVLPESVGFNRAVDWPTFGDALGSAGVAFAAEWPLLFFVGGGSHGVTHRVWLVAPADVESKLRPWLASSGYLGPRLDSAADLPATDVRSVLIVRRNAAIADLVEGSPDHYRPVGKDLEIDLPKKDVFKALTAAMGGDCGWTLPTFKRQSSGAKGEVTLAFKVDKIIWLRRKIPK